MIKKYPRTMMAIHWITLIAVATAYITSGNPIKEPQLGTIHLLSGGTVFVLFCLRCIAFLALHKDFPKNQILGKFQHFAFKSVKVLLYALLIIVPVSGFIALSSITQHYVFFGLNLPLIFSVYGIHGLGNIHQVLGNIFIYLVGLHACAALFHHFVVKDNVLKSML
ncbi:cytochrome b [Acinetobacter sp. MB5]|uniref:cytochrome b n=1 Tax=Acinetobacter sp. MB5 TaxID=2069438 RepID=UPI000DD0570A|nr:cytochrome b/b6 domain-containing protein [Acinetobacter sp. MB5]